MELPAILDFAPLNSPPMMHAIAVHLPLALSVLGVVLVYLCAAVSSEKATLRWITVACYALMTASAYAAKMAGHRAMEALPNTLSPEIWEAIEQHEEMGDIIWMLALASTVLVLASIPNVRVLRVPAMGFAMMVSTATVLFVGLTGHYGGSLVYEHGLGTALMEAAPPAQDTAEPSVDGADSDSEPEARRMFPDIRSIDMEEARQVSFARDVRPIFTEYCEECHNPDKTKGDLDITSVALLHEEGRKAGPGIVPGAPDESAIVQYIRGALTPQMPKGEDPIDGDDLHVIRMWIAAGAVDDSEPNQTVAEVLKAGVISTR